MRIEKPRQSSYDLFLAAKDNSGNYSDPLNFQIEHPGIQKLVLEEQDVTGLLSTIKIIFPKVFTEGTSQEVYPNNPQSEEKEILGYRLYLQEIDYDTEEPIGSVETVDIDAEELYNRTYFYQAETGKKFEIRVGAYDSVYHPVYNQTLFESTLSDWVIGETMKVQAPDIPDDLIEPNKLTEELRGDVEDIDSLRNEYTWKVGSVLEDGTPVMGGFGLAVDETEEIIDFQIVADKFRVYPTDATGQNEGTSIFSIDTEEDLIFLDASQITLRAGNEEWGNFFDLDENGLSIQTDDFQLDKSGNAMFSGEVQAEIFTLNSDSFLLNQTEFDYTVGDNNVNMNSQGFSISTDTFNLEKDGTIGIFGKKNLTIDLNATSPYLKMEDDQGNYTLLDNEHLKFYESGNDHPYWYSKRVVYDTVESGTYIDLTNEQGETTWETVPKVQTAISSIQTYYASESDVDIFYECFATDITREGFRVVGKAYAPLGEGNSYYNNYTLNGGETISPDYSTGEEVTRITVSIYHRKDSGTGVALNCYYKQVGESSWTMFYSYDLDYFLYRNFKYYLSELPVGDYEFKFENIRGNELELDIKSNKYDYIEDGEVFYMAIEGGSSD